MTVSGCETWSIRKSLAFLAATFAIVFAALLPAAVAASPALGAPIQLCSGETAFVLIDEEGRPTPQPDEGSRSLDCAMALLSGLAASAPGATPMLVAPDAEPPAYAPPTVSVWALLKPAAPPPPSTAPPRLS